MNICLMNDSFPPVIDGVANTVVNYANIITKNYGSALVATPQYPGVEDDYPFPVIRYPSIDTTKKTGYRAGQPFAPEIVGTLASRPIDIIHSHCPITSTWLARLLRDQVNAPVILTYHTKFDIDIAKAVRGKHIQEAAIKLLVSNISACDEVWVVSSGAGANLQSLGYQGSYVVMENGVDLPKGPADEYDAHLLDRQYQLPQGVPVFLFVGRLMWYKGLRIILDSLADLNRQGQDFRMVFIGDGGDKDQVVQYANTVSLADKCIFTGSISDRSKLRAWYTRADLLLFPSTFDTNGLVVREAAACGLGSMLISGSCAAEGITDGHNGILIDETPQSMTAELKKLLAKPEKMQDIGQTAMDEIYISWEESIDRAWQRYNVVLDKWRSGLMIRKKAPADSFFTKSGDLLEGLDKVRQRGNEHLEKVHQRGSEHLEKIRDHRQQLHDLLDRYL